MRLFQILGIVALALSLPAGEASASAAGKRVAVLTAPNQNPYIGAWNPVFLQAAEAHGMKVTNFTTPYDAALQSQQVDDAIAQKFDLLVIDTMNHKAIVPALTRAKAAGVPVILVITPIETENEALFVSYVGPDDESLGRLAGENLIKGLAAIGKTEAQVAAVTGFASQLGTQRRMAGFRKALAGKPAIKLIAEEDGKWNTAQSEKIAGELMVRFAGRGGVDGIYGMADNQATGIISAVDAAGIKLGPADKGMIVVGSNCMRDGILNIRAGKQYGTNSEIPAEEAKAAADKAAAFLDGGTLKKYEFVTSYAITRDNVEQFAQACSY